MYTFNEINKNIESNSSVFIKEFVSILKYISVD